MDEPDLTFDKVLELASAAKAADRNEKDMQSIKIVGIAGQSSQTSLAEVNCATAVEVTTTWLIVI